MRRHGISRIAEGTTFGFQQGIGEAQRQAQQEEI